MTRAFVVVAAIFCAFAFGFSPEAKAQIVTATQDSVVVSTPADSATQAKPKFISGWSSPAKAAFYSAIVPGGGQYYNKSYWKIPLVYATQAVIAYFIIDNNKKYQRFATAYKLRTDGDPNTVDDYTETYGYRIDLPNNQGTNNLRNSRDYFRKYRDLDIILAIVAHGLSIMEAHVDAHLKGFDVSDDLSLHIKPDVKNIPTAPYTPMLTLQFDLKK